uniref:Putative disease resistance protein RGA3 n=1 Tax=Davidia involucrata TaxID=16924 RepID=A0A5B7B2Y9_DAVIN
MAEQMLFNFSENILLKLGSYAIQQIGLALGVTKESTKLEKKISTVRNVLLDAQEKQVSNPAVRAWLERLKDIVYDTDDLVDEFATEALRRQVEIHGSILREFNQALDDCETVGVS